MTTEKQINPNIEIRGLLRDVLPEAAAVMLPALHRIAERWSSADLIDVYPNERTDSGWLEWTVVIHKGGDRQITIGLIQRQPGAMVESHS